MGKLDFTKMHGCGNDYVYIDCFKQDVEAPELLARTLSDRHKGVGGDGVILICPSETADAKMRMFNADGSEGRMCGNGVRCVAEYLFRHGYASGTAADVETLSGVKHIVRREPGLLTVDMGAPELAPEKIPVTGFAKPVVNELVEVNGGGAYDLRLHGQPALCGVCVGHRGPESACAGRRNGTQQMVPRGCEYGIYSDFG